jgi:hypothetical protein
MEGSLQREKKMMNDVSVKKKEGIQQLKFGPGILQLKFGSFATKVTSPQPGFEQQRN